jgi:hypothetical protein
MLASSSVVKTQAVIGLSVFIIGIWLAMQTGQRIAADDFRSIEFAVMAVAACAVALTIVRNWRTGFYMFLTWLLFEDLVRKYLGNNMAIYFAKDILVGLVYVSFLIEVRRKHLKLFRSAFFPFLWLFVWFGAVQIFNQNSPHLLYGLLGFKLYFYYIPLMFVSYALIRTDEDLRKFLLVNISLAGVISAIGIAQAILGHSFLNPTNLAPELKDLGELDRTSPITHQVLSLPTAVFVSSGRFGFYILVAVIMTCGAAAYLLLSTSKYHKWVFTVIALVGGASIFSGSRGSVTFGGASVIILSIGFMWGAPWRWQQAHRMVKAIRNGILVLAIGFTLIFVIFPEEIAPRIAFYTESLNPNSDASEVGNRAWSYPIRNLLGALSEPNWIVGSGIGTASLGGQYVAKLIGRPPLDIWVEEGYGVLIVEMGIAGPFIWLLWTGALVWCGFTVMRRLRQTRFFPIAFAMWWYIFVLLFPLTYGGMSAYQNFVTNMYLWLFVGILFRLPEMQAAVPSYYDDSAVKKPNRRGYMLPQPQTIPQEQIY